MDLFDSKIWLRGVRLTFAKVLSCDTDVDLTVGRVVLKYVE